ncbi:hypothetical protein LTR66_010040, partial [Elasticomyces elasticus]
DVRATEIDKVDLCASVRTGDIVRAVVLGLGDERAYFVGTARNELGVVMAWAEGGGEALAPVSWREMRGVRSGVLEERKVAKPV